MLLYVFLYVVGVYIMLIRQSKIQNNITKFIEKVCHKNLIYLVYQLQDIFKKNLLCCVGVKSAWICFEFIYYVCIHGIQNLGDGLSYNTEGFLKHLVIRDILPTLTASLPWQG